MATRPTPEFIRAVSGLTAAGRERKRLQTDDGMKYAAVTNADAQLRAAHKEGCARWAEAIRGWADDFISHRNGYTIRGELMKPSHDACWLTILCLALRHEAWNGTHELVHRFELNLEPEGLKGRYRYTVWLDGTKVTHFSPFRHAHDLAFHLSPPFLSESASMIEDGRIWDELARHLEERRQAIIDDR